MQGNEHCMGTFPYIKKLTNKINTGEKDFRFLANTRQPQRSEIHRSIPWPTTKIQTKKQPGEKEPGKFHYNPGNMSGKTIRTSKDESAQSNADSRHEQQDKKAVDNR